jgi:hypothetical protein
LEAAIYIGTHLSGKAWWYTAAHEPDRIDPAIFGAHLAMFRVA